MKELSEGEMKEASEKLQQAGQKSEDKPRKKELGDAIEKQKIIYIEYSDVNLDYSERRIWPFALAFWGKAWTLASWCEKRQDFRAFRLDRMHNINVSKQLFQTTEKICLQVFIDKQTPNK